MLMQFKTPPTAPPTHKHTQLTLRHLLIGFLKKLLWYLCSLKNLLFHHMNCHLATGTFRGALPPQQLWFKFYNLSWWVRSSFRVSQLSFARPLWCLQFPKHFYCYCLHRLRWIIYKSGGVSEQHPSHCSVPFPSRSPPSTFNSQRKAENFDIWVFLRKKKLCRFTGRCENVELKQSVRTELFLNTECSSEVVPGCGDCKSFAYIDPRACACVAQMLM